MKKIFFIILLITFCAVQVFAQDNIPVYTLRNHGYYHDKPWMQECDDTAGGWDFAVSSAVGLAPCLTTSQLYVTDTSLTIYGLAGVFMHFQQYDSALIIEQAYPRSIIDTCLSNTFDTLYMHDFDTTGSMHILKSVRCGYSDTIAGRLYFPYNHAIYNSFARNELFSLGYGIGVYCTNPDLTTSGIYDVREVFFDTAISISDSFYVAAQNHNMLHRVNNDNVPNRSFMMIVFSSNCMPNSDFVICSCYPGTMYIKNSPLTFNKQAMLGIFPILTPPPAVDTTGHGGDTTAVDKVDGIGRYVSLSPNPAEDKVQVLSSFGLKQVEAYNAEGRLVYADEAHGLSKTIDLTAWPRGIYLVRIVTPMGSTTKKLILR